MPHKPKRPCSYPSCPALTDGRYCDHHQKEMDARYERYERDPATQKRYGQKWRQIRQSYMAKHPLCEACRKIGKLTPAREIHHRTPLAKGGTHAQENLMSLCRSCHSRITAKEGGRWG
jgi:5-methylcytosine-specific restriction enzyme A